MGAYRSQPDEEKNTSRFQDENVTVGCSDMCGWRMHNEDAHVVHLGENRSIFAVFDGHGGAQVARFAADHLIDIANKFNLGPDTDDRTYQDFVIALDAEIHQKLDSNDVGATSIIMFMFPAEKVNDKRTYTLKVLNSGDSRSVCKLKSELYSTRDHKPKDEDEQTRIHNAGGFIQLDRVNGDLALSRALGDHRYKTMSELPPEKQVITCFPDVYTWTATEGDYLCLACDGIFDVLSNEQLFEFIEKTLPEVNHNLGRMCEQTMSHCLADNPNSRNGMGADNMTLVIVKVRDGSEPPLPIEAPKIETPPPAASTISKTEIEN